MYFVWSRADGSVAPGIRSNSMSGDLHPAPGPETAKIADLGLPAPRNRPWRRLLARLAWPVLKRQIDVNHWTEAQLADVRAQVADAQVRLQGIEGAVHVRVEQLNEAQKTLERFESTLETVGEILRRHEKAIGNAQEQSFARQVASEGIIRREMGELALELNDFRSTYAMSMASILPKLAATELVSDRRPVAGSVTEEHSKSREHSGPASDLGAFDVALAEAFRGPELVIRDRVREYLPDLEPAGSLGPILDVGCGRGELLQVLKQAGVEAYGIDSNALCVSACQERDLSVLEIDAQSHLESVQESSLGAVTAIHVVEHLAIEELVWFVDLCMRAIKPGGKLIFETPNPENLMVASLSFYLDPTHRRPLPPDLLKFILASRGIVEIEVRRLARGERALADPMDGEPWFGDVKPAVDVLNAHFAAPSDYAVIATRP
jgi:O-antigen chain-terminating methyltransferase